MVRHLAALLAALVVLATSGSAQAQSDVPARSARAFGDSVGVNVRLTYLDASYGDFDGVAARLRELGVRYVSDSLCPTCEFQIDRLNRLAKSGIHSMLGIGWWSGDSTVIPSSLAVVRNRLRSSVVALTGVNEPDLTGAADWVSRTRSLTASLYTHAKADPALAPLPVIGPSLVFRSSRTQLGDLSAYVDRGNLHPYPGGLPPLGYLEDERQMMSQVTGNKPLVITEVGYHTDLAETGPHRPASERAVGIYTPRIVLEAFRFGIERTFIYQLADLWSDAEAARRGYPKSQNSFGLLRWDLTPKPSFIALRNLLRAVDADSAPVAAPGSLRYALSGAGPDVRQLLLRAADGSFRLALWRDVSVWNRDTQQDLTPAPEHVDVVLGERISQARRYDPNVSGSATGSWDEPRKLGVDLGGSAVVLELIPPGTPADRAGGGAGAGRRGLRAGRRLGGCTARKGRPLCCKAAAKHRRRGHRQRARRGRRHHAAHGARAGRRMHARWTGACVSVPRR